MSALETAFCSSAAWHRFVVRRVLPWLVTELPDRGHLVEIGAGSGGLADLLLRQRPDLQVTAVDLDPRMLRQARRRLDRHGPRAQVLRASATALPVSLDGQVDVVLSMLMLHHTLDLPGVLRSAVTALRPGGQLVGYDLTATRLAAVVHTLDRSPYKLVPYGELRAALQGPAWRGGTATRHAAGHLMRFRAERSPSQPSADAADRG